MLHVLRSMAPFAGLVATDLAVPTRQREGAASSCPSQQRAYTLSACAALVSPYAGGAWLGRDLHRGVRIGMPLFCHGELVRRCSTRSD